MSNRRAIPERTRYDQGMRKTPYFLPALLFVSTALSTAARAEGFKSSIYEQGSNKTKLLFTGERVEKGNQATVTTQSPDGKVAVIEEATVQEGDPSKIVRFQIHQKQTGEEGTLEVKDGKLHFSYTKNGKTDTDTEDYKENTIVGPTTLPYLKKHWDKILAGDDVDVRYASLDRKETVGFKFFKIGETDKAIIVKMKPTSIVIAAIVDPLIFTFYKDGSKLYELKGRAVPKRNVDGKWKDLDADIVFKY